MSDLRYFAEHPDMDKAPSLRARRLALGWSLDQLARLLDRDTATVGAWEAEDAPERGRSELLRAVRAIERSRLLIRRMR